MSNPVVEEIEMRKLSLPLLFLLLSLSGFAQTSTYTVSVQGEQGSACGTLENCIVSLGGSSSVWEYFTEWMQFAPGYPNQALFCQSPTVSGGNPFTATCSGVSSFDRTSYSMSLSENWTTFRGCGRAGCRTYYIVTGGSFSLTASNETLHALGIQGY